MGVPATASSRQFSSGFLLFVGDLDGRHGPVVLAPGEIGRRIGKGVSSSWRSIGKLAPLRWRRLRQRREVRVLQRVVLICAVQLGRRVGFRVGGVVGLDGEGVVVYAARILGRLGSTVGSRKWLVGCRRQGTGPDAVLVSFPPEPPDEAADEPSTDEGRCHGDACDCDVAQAALVCACLQARLCHARVVAHLDKALLGAVAVGSIAGIDGAAADEASRFVGADVEAALAGARTAQVRHHGH